jgi:hypothetical protein
MDIIEQANEVVAQMGTDKVRRAHVCGCFSCKAAARDFIGWLASNGDESDEAAQTDLAVTSEG